MNHVDRAVRREVLGSVAAAIAATESGHTLRVAVDGITASGKTTFADELATAVEAVVRPVVRLSMDGFHNPITVRYRLGPESADGYYEDAYDFSSFVANVLEPLGPGGDGAYVPAIIDLATDTALVIDAVRPPDGAILIVDGSFLQRRELVENWDVVIWVEASFSEARRRGVARDAARLGGADRAGQLFDQRYHAACRRYIAETGPARIADLVIDNEDPARPTAMWRVTRSSTESRR